jgi:hypothetical protein
MRSIGEFFSKIKSRQAQEIFLRTIIQQVLKKVAGIDVEISQIAFKGFTVNVKGLSQPAKAQLFMKKGAALKEIEIQSPGRRITDIRSY